MPLSQIRDKTLGGNRIGIHKTGNSCENKSYNFQQKKGSTVFFYFYKICTQNPIWLAWNPILNKQISIKWKHYKTDLKSACIMIVWSHVLIWPLSSKICMDQNLFQSLNEVLKVTVGLSIIKWLNNLLNWKLAQVPQYLLTKWASSYHSNRIRKTLWECIY